MTDVVIAGAGPAGLALALYLVRQDINVVVLERDAQLNKSPRAIVYLHNLLPDLDAIGMLTSMRRRGVEDHDGFTMHLPATDEIINIPMTVLDGIDPYPYNINLGQGEFCEIALEQLQKYPSATVHFNAEVTGVTDSGTSVEVTCRTPEGDRSISAQWLVGADGAQSFVRKRINATLEGTTWDQRFVATNVRFDFGARGFNSSNMYVDPEIGCIVARITTDGLWRCTYQEPVALPEETAGDRIHDHFVKLLGEKDAAEVEVVDFRPYRMHQRLSTKLRQGRVVLVGDAAHLTNPTGGLGLTTGIYDVILLQETLGAVLRGERDESLLDDYAAERSRVFSEQSSPNAVMFKRLVYDSTDLDALNKQVQPLREAAATTESQRGFLSNVDSIRSPSLLTV
jgi:3-(3-hydroxy-phenyl)propionate hydroxylase